MVVDFMEPMSAVSAVEWKRTASARSWRSGGREDGKAQSSVNSGFFQNLECGATLCRVEMNLTTKKKNGQVFVSLSMESADAAFPFMQ
jgi:hypothetical protein